MLLMEKNSTFCDVGCHFGDTILTMALHARKKGRGDLRFIGFEPSSMKCEFIRQCMKDNDLGETVKIVRCCVSDVCGRGQVRVEGGGLRVGWGNDIGALCC